MSSLTEFSSLESAHLLQKQKRTGILGGTFNPVHNGHIDMAYIALYEFLLGEIVFLPVGMPPHKCEEYVAPSCDRLKMVQLAISDEKRFRLSTVETDRSGPTYTVDTLELLARGDLDGAYYYIIGSDTLFELMSWRHIERVMMLTDFICILRPGQEEHSVKRFAANINNRYGQKIHIARERGPNISSSMIRSLAANNKLCDGLVPKNVAAYIRRNNVYSKEA